MSRSSVKELFDAGVHFGHQTKRWNPKMRPFIYGARNGIHIIDLDQTARLFKRAFDFLSETVARGGSVLFVGTKRQAQEIVQEEARRSGMYFVTNRWLGGTLTNFRTIKGGLERLRTLERMKEDGTYSQLPKKETVAAREGARAPREVHRRPQGHGRACRTPIFVIDPRAGDDRGQRGASKLEHPDRRHHRHELRSGHGRLRDPGQRRRDPLGPADHRRASPTPASTAPLVVASTRTRTRAAMPGRAASRASPKRRSSTPTAATAKIEVAA